MAAGDIKLRYGTAVDVTITAASLATSPSRLAGYESAVVDNTILLAQNYLVSGKFTTGTGVTASNMELWCIPSWDGTTWPSVFDGVNSAKTIPNAEVKVGLLRGLVWSVGVNTTNSITYHFAGGEVASLFSNVVPPKFSFFLTHSTGTPLDPTAGNHQLRIQPVFTNVE